MTTESTTMSKYQGNNQWALVAETQDSQPLVALAREEQAKRDGKAARWAANLGLVQASRRYKKTLASGDAEAIERAKADLESARSVYADVLRTYPSK